MKRLLAIAAFALLLTPTQADALLCGILGCSCSVTATPLEFLPFSPLTGDQDGEGVLTVDCTGVAELSPSVTTIMNAGKWGTISARKMRSSTGELLSYNIYTTSQRNVIWGGGGTGSSVNITSTLLAIGHWRTTRSYYGRASPTTATKPGHYEDEVTVRIVW